MESLWETVVYSWLAATGALVAFVIFTWFKATAAREEARSRASAPRAAAARMRHQRRVT